MPLRQYIDKHAGDPRLLFMTDMHRGSPLISG